jgi:hypothetical protein
MDWVLLSLFGAACGWAVLRVLGGERARRVQELETRLVAEAANAAVAEPPAKR